MINWEMIFGLLRSLGVALLGYLVGKGYLTSDQASTVSNLAVEAAPVIGMLALAGYGAWKKRDAAKVEQAGKVDGARVTVDPKVASKDVVDAALKAPDSEIKIGPLPTKP